jgi:hypothetical protein
VTAVGNEADGFEERKKRSNWYDEESQINV